MEAIRVGFAFCGSFCTFQQAMPALERARARYGDVTPIVSETAAVMIDVRDDAIYQGLYAHSDYRFLPIKDYPACRTGWLKSRALPLSPLAEDFIAIFERMAREAD